MPNELHYLLEEIKEKYILFFIFKISGWVKRRVRCKSKLRYDYRKKLKNIVENASPLLDYGSTRTCSLLNLIKTAKHELSSNTIIFKKFETVEEKTDVLIKWYGFYKSRIEACYGSQIGELFNEFGQILIQIQKIFKEIIENLTEESVARKLKRDLHGYPLARQIFQTVAVDFVKLTEEASQNLEEVKKWEHIFSLP